MLHRQKNMTTKTDVGAIIGGVLICAIVLKLAWDITIQELGDRPELCYPLLATLGFLSVASLLNDVKTILCGGIIASIATIGAYWIFDRNSLPILIILTTICIILGAYQKINTKH